MRLLIMLVLIGLLSGCHVNEATYVQQLIDNHGMPKISIGQKMKMQSDTTLLSSPNFSAQGIEYLQSIEVEILKIEGFFAYVRTLSFSENMEGWLSLWALHPDSAAAGFYRNNPMKLVAHDTTARPFPGDIEGHSVIDVKKNHPIQVRRMTEDYFEIQLFGDDGKQYSNVWIKKSDVKAYDPDLVVLGAISEGTVVTLTDGSTYFAQSSEIVWKEADKGTATSVVVRLTNGKTGEINKNAFIRNPFYSLSGYGHIDNEILIWSEMFPPNEESLDYTFHISSNLSLDQHSAEEAIKTSFEKGQKNDSEQPVDFIFKWVSEKDFYVYVKGIQHFDTFRFNLEDAYTSDFLRLGDVVKEKMRLFLYASYLPERKEAIHLFSAKNMESMRVEVPAFLDYRLIQLADGKEQLLIYADSDDYNLYDLQLQEKKDIPKLSSILDTPFDNLDEMASDRWAEDSTYVVLGGIKLYFFDIKNKKGKLLYHSDKPIYGLSLSPEKERIAVLVSSERYSEASADLLILDKEGTIVSTFEKAGYVPHSDGVYSIYDVEWVNDRTVVVERYVDGKQGKASIDVISGEMEENALPYAELNKSGIAMKLLPGGEEIPIVNGSNLKTSAYDQIYYKLSPDGSYIVLSIADQLYLYSKGTKEVQWFGVGHFVKWTGDDTLLWMQGYQPYFMF